MTNNLTTGLYPNDPRWQDSDEMLELIAHLLTIQENASSIRGLTENPDPQSTAPVIENSYRHSRKILRECEKLIAKINSVRSVIEANIRQDFDDQPPPETRR